MYKDRPSLKQANKEIKENYPFSNSLKNVQPQLDKENTFFCKMYPSKFKNKIGSYQIFIDNTFLIFCSVDKNESLTIKNKYLLQFIEIRVDKQDGKNMDLRVKEGNEIIYLVCQFDQPQTTLIIKEKIEKLKNFIKESEINHLLAYLEELTTI